MTARLILSFDTPVRIVKLRGGLASQGHRPDKDRQDFRQCLIGERDGQTCPPISNAEGALQPRL
jgi:hypothetical protein